MIQQNFFLSLSSDIVNLQNNCSHGYWQHTEMKEYFFLPDKCTQRCILLFFTAFFSYSGMRFWSFRVKRKNLKEKKTFLLLYSIHIDIRETLCGLGSLNQYGISSLTILDTALNIGLGSYEYNVTRAHCI